jgi:hypothetical protein
VKVSATDMWDLFKQVSFPKDNFIPLAAARDLHARLLDFPVMCDVAVVSCMLHRSPWMPR